MLPRLGFALFAGILLTAGAARAQTIPAGTMLVSSRPVPVGQAPGMQVRQIKATADERVYAVIFHAGDEAMSGLTDFAIANKVADAHFTVIGAASGATVAWLDPAAKQYRAIPVRGQHEVLCASRQYRPGEWEAKRPHAHRAGRPGRRNGRGPCL